MPATKPPQETIAEAIEQRIASGAWRTGSKLPTQAALAAEFGAGRHVVRQAIQLLERRELVHSRQGSGTFVAGRLVDYYVKSRTRYNDNVQPLAQTSHIEILDLRQRRIDAQLARDLGIGRHGRIFDLHLLRWTGSDPLCVARHYFPAGRFPHLPDHIGSVTGISDLIRRMGLEDFRRSDTAISARLPTRAEAQMLRVAADSPVLILEGRNVDGAGRPIEISTSVWPASRIKVHV